MRIGLVDLDTSHPKSWLPILREQPDVSVTAVCDGGAVHDPGYAKTFAAENDIPHAVDLPEEMVDVVDAAIIHSCNWDVHLDRAAPFIDAGKPVFLDKPVVGCHADIEKLKKLVDQGADIIGGSSLRFADEVTQFAREHSPSDVVTLFGTCPNDLYNYGIHGYEMILGATGPGIESVRHLGGNEVALIEMRFSDGRQALLQLKTPAGRFHLTASTRRGIKSFGVGASGSLYVPLIRRIVAHFTQEKPYPLSISEIIEPSLAALAALMSAKTGEWVALDHVDGSISYDGHAFEAEYRATRRGAAAG